jgi:hypothetical protein
VGPSSKEEAPDQVIVLIATSIMNQAGIILEVLEVTEEDTATLLARIKTAQLLTELPPASAQQLKVEVLGGCSSLSLASSESLDISQSKRESGRIKDEKKSLSSR